MKMVSKRSFWVMLTIYSTLWFVISMVAGVVLDGYKGTINHSLGLSGFKTETITTENEDLEYFKSNYVQKDENGEIKYVVDENGYKHQLYDDKALWDANVKKAMQVQKEGTTILWNNNNGLPLIKGNKVSLFSHSSVDYVYSGVGSGAVRTNGVANMKTAFETAGLTINSTLWDFYLKGDGKEYTRTEKMYVNEVPWSKYSDNVKNSFSAYGDAAIITISRQLGEGSGQSGVKDAATSLADTLSGDYFDISAQEKRMIEEVIKYKNNGVFSKIIVLLNTPTGMWFDPLFNYKNDIDSCVWVGQGGYVGLYEVGNILVGDSIPSGHLVDTFVYNTQSEASFVNLSAKQYTNARSYPLDLYQQGAYTTYVENIYVGYRYYETRYEDSVLNQGNAISKAGVVCSKNNWKYSEEVAYPFGYGGDYSRFEYSNYSVTKNAEGDYEVNVVVKNTGDKVGQDAVQVYVQKPYTEYDKQYGLEQSAINLFGYSKTKELQPNESENVSIIIDDEAFRTYDDENKKTYIREKGDYYIAIGSDAHDAINNILAAKGKTPANTNNVMDAEGNANFVSKFTFAEDDFETYSVSETTGQVITNQFEDTDWNKYINKTDAKITYLSRKDWDATYPRQVVEFSLNDAMVADLGYNKDVAINPGDEMPLYNQPHTFNLIDMKGLDYNHSAWDTLLNQLSFEDYPQLFMAYNGTGAINHISKQEERAEDGPLGVRLKYQTNYDHYAMGWPSTVLLAATFNDQLAEEVGELMGEDMLHAGVTTLYGPGANLHRSTYGGRSFEYYSEDGFISGIMAKQQVIGIQSKGCTVQMKHYALNDQESNRHGGAIWCEEQSIRELYLEAFRYSVEDGNLTGLMSSFSRFGTIWSGAHKGLMTNVLRGEWGFKGFVISDAAWRVYMGPVDGVMAGNDAILTDNTAIVPIYDVAKTNPTVALAMREAAHRMLYVVVNSNAMNGFSSNTKVYEVKEWWQHMVTGIQIGIGCTTGLLLTATILAFVFNDKIKDWAKKKTLEKAKKRKEENQMNNNEDVVTSPDGKKKVISPKMIGLGVGLLAIILTAIIVPSMLNKEETPSTGIPSTETPPSVSVIPSTGNTTSSVNPEDETLRDQLEGDVKDYRFEAECAEIETDIVRLGAGLESTIAANNYPSGDAYIHHLTDAGNAKLRFYVTASESGKAVLSMCMGRAGTARKVSNFFDISINGVTINIDSTIEFGLYETVMYYDWLQLEISMVDLNKGENVIEFIKKGKGLNFDYIELASAQTLQDTREVKNGHTYEAWSVIKEPSLTQEGEIGSYCKTCRNYKVEKLPVLSEENGYEKRVTSSNSDTTFGEAVWTYEKDGQKFEFINRLLPNNAKTFKFEAERMGISGDATIGQEIQANASGGAYVGHTHKSEWTITTRITSTIACQALFIMNVSPRNTYNVALNDGRTLTVNGKQVTIPSDVVFEAVESDNAYFNFAEFEVMIIDLQAGLNTITLSNASKNFVNIDYYKFVTAADLAWYYEE